MNKLYCNSALMHLLFYVYEWSDSNKSVVLLDEFDTQRNESYKHIFLGKKYSPTKRANEVVPSRCNYVVILCVKLQANAVLRFISNSIYTNQRTCRYC
jgi:hypothetical protein